jgi:DNA-binding PadR family transcriptional regulator
LQNRIKFDIYQMLNEEELSFGDLIEALNGKGKRHLWKPNRMTVWRYLTEAREKGHVTRNQRIRYGLTTSGRAELDELQILMNKSEESESLRTASTYHREQIHSLGEIPPDYDSFRREVFGVMGPIEFYRIWFGLPHPVVIPVTTTLYGSSELTSIFRQAGVWALAFQKDKAGLSGKLLKRQFQPIVSELVWNYLSQNIFRLYTEHFQHRKGSARPTLENILGFKLSFSMTFDGKGYMENLAKTFDKEERKRVGKRLVGIYLLEVARGDFVPLIDGVAVFDGAGLIEKEDAVILKNMLGQEAEDKNREIVTEMAWRYLAGGGVISVKDRSEPDGLS